MAGDTVFTWDSVSGWPTTGDFIIRMDHPSNGTIEYVLCTSVNVGAIQTTVTRAQESTSASGGFIIGSTGANVFSRKMYDDSVVRLDTAVSQTLTGPLAIPTALGAAPAATSYGTVPLKFAETLLGASAATVTFSSIPSTFRHLKHDWFARGDTAAASTSLGLRFNNISTNVYEWQNLQGSAAAATASEGLTQPQILIANIPANTATANYFGAGEVRVKHYAGTTGNKASVANFAVATGDTTGLQTGGQLVGKWRTTATAISRLDVFPLAGNVVAGSFFSVQLEP